MLHRVRPEAQSHWIRVGKGRLTASECPGKPKLAEMRPTHVVTLLREDEQQLPTVREMCTEEGIGWLHLSISGAGLGRTQLMEENNVASLMRLPEVLPLLEVGGSVLVHCGAGMHRTGVSCYIVLRLAGWSSDEAVEGVRQMRAVTHEELMKERRNAFVLFNLAEELAATMMLASSRQC